MLDFFPNVREIFFKASGLRWSREPAEGDSVKRINRFTVTERLRVHNGAIAPPHAFSPPPNVEYEVSYSFESSWEPLGVPPFTRDGDGEVLLPAVLQLPFDEVDAEGTCPSETQWITILEQRKRLGIPTRSISWSTFEGYDFSRLASVVGPHLEELHLHLFPAMESLSTVLNEIMDGLHRELMPGLEHLLVRIHFSHMIAPETQERGPTTYPSWTTNDMPDKLETLSLFLVVDNAFEDDDWSDDNGSITPSEVQEDVRQALPISWIRNVRLKFGESLDIRIEVLRDFGHGLEDWDEPFDETLGRALFAPITIDRSTQTAGRCTCNCEA